MFNIKPKSTRCLTIKSILVLTKVDIKWLKLRQDQRHKQKRKC